MTKLNKKRQNKVKHDKIAVKIRKMTKSNKKTIKMKQRKTNKTITKSINFYEDQFHNWYKILYVGSTPIPVSTLKQPW